MNKTRLAFCSSLILMMLWSIEGWAQFNPDNPSEPSMKYNVKLECDPEGIAGLYGGGSYSDGDYIYIGAYSYNSNYVFQYWEHDGEIYSRSNSFMYKISSCDVKFIAHFKYAPNNPEEPNARFYRRLYLKSEPEGIASFCYSNGLKFELGSNVPIYETGRKYEYVFLGWYDGDEVVSYAVEFNYTIPDRDVTLVARYSFNPDSPTNPGEFYATSCDLLAESNDIDKGVVGVEGLDKGRAKYGSSVTLKATPYDGFSFSGWYLNGVLLSTDATYVYVVPSSDDRIHIIGVFVEREDEPASVWGVEPFTEIRAYDILGREVDINSIKKGPLIVCEFLNGKAIRTYKIFR